MPRLAESSKVLMSFLLEKKLITHNPQSKKTKQLFKVLYTDLLRADEYIQNVQKKEEEMGTPFFNPQIIKINNVTHIPKSKMFNDSAFPVGVQKHIKDNSTFTLSYTFSLLERKITIHMIVEKSITPDNISIYNEHIRKILIWLTIVHE
jgi:methyl coenzyme M reductase alpha subunit